jgi:hypothetical protein
LLEKALVSTDFKILLHEKKIEELKKKKEMILKDIKNNRFL